MMNLYLVGNTKGQSVTYKHIAATQVKVTS